MQARRHQHRPICHGPDGPNEGVKAFGDITVAPLQRVHKVECTLWRRGADADRQRGWRYRGAAGTLMTVSRGPARPPD